MHTENSATSAMNVSPTSDNYLGLELGQYVAKFATLKSNVVFILTLLPSSLQALHSFLNLQENTFGNICPFQLLPLLSLEKRKKKNHH